MHLMEVLWNFDGGIMESLWKFHGENLRLEYGETVENQHTGKLQTRKNQKTRYNGVVREPNGRTEHATENHRLGKHRKRQRGTNWSFLGSCWNNRG